MVPCARLHHKFESHWRSISSGDAAHSSNFGRFKSCAIFIRIFWSHNGPRPDVWLVSQQLHASRFDMESAIVGYSMIIGRMCVWKRGGCPARGTHCLSSFRPIGDVSKLNTLWQYMYRRYFCAPTGRLAEEVAVLQQLNECMEQNANEEVPIELLHPNANGCIGAGV